MLLGADGAGVEDEVVELFAGAVVLLVVVVDEPPQASPAISKEPSARDRVKIEFGRFTLFLLSVDLVVCV